MKQIIISLLSGMLLLASGARAEDKYSLFGIILGDNINKYNPNIKRLEKPRLCNDKLDDDESALGAALRNRLRTSLKI